MRSRALLPGLAARVQPGLDQDGEAAGLALEPHGDGRLLCCLGYENSYYTEAKARLPKIGESVPTSSGQGRVVGINALKETVNVQLESEAIIEVSAEELKAGLRGSGNRQPGHQPPGEQELEDAEGNEA